MELQYGPNKIWMENEAGTIAIKKRPPAAPTPTPGSAATKTNRIYLDNQDENLLDLSTFMIE